MLGRMASFSRCRFLRMASSVMVYTDLSIGARDMKGAIETETWSFCRATSWALLSRSAKGIHMVVP